MSERILGLRVHPAASLFPLLEGEELAALAADIEKQGLQEKIVVYDEQILDGRNRARAIEVSSPYCVGSSHEDWDGSPDSQPLTPNPFRFLKSLPNGVTPAEYVTSANLHRRHLTQAQRKELAGKLALLILDEQKDKPKSEKVDALEQAAKLSGVSRRTAASAKAELEGKPKPASKFRPLRQLRPLRQVGEIIEDAEFEEIIEDAEFEVVQDPDEDGDCPVGEGLEKAMSDPLWQVATRLQEARAWAERLPEDTEPDDIERLLELAEDVRELLAEKIEAGAA